jgi:hypothetical protein
MEQVAHGKLSLGLADQLPAYIHDRANQPLQDEKCEDGLGPYAKPSRLLDPIISRKLRDDVASSSRQRSGRDCGAMFARRKRRRPRGSILGSASAGGG